MKLLSYDNAFTKIQAISIILVIVIVAAVGIYLFELPAEQPPITTTTGDLSEWKADGLIDDREYPHSSSLSDRFTIYWRNDNQFLYMALEGETSGWVAIGFEPTNRMKDADMVFGWVENGQVTILDLYSTGTTGPHPPDDQLGGTNDIIESDGKEENGYTIIEFKRRLNTGDEYDNSLLPDSEVTFIWSMSNEDDFAVKHNIDTGSGKIKLD
jgi:hypothetical protein